MSFSGKCLCGAVRYACSATPVLSGNCHCRDCQKASGSAFVPTIFVPESAVVIDGEVTYYESLGGSGAKVSRGFCPNCGSPLFGRAAVMPGLLAIKAGSMDDTSLYSPSIDIYVSHAAAWEYIAPTANIFAEAPTVAAS